MNTLVVAEQLRRRVPGGVGTYVRGLAAGLRHLPNANVTYWASRVSGDADDPVSALGGSVLRSPLPSKLLMRAWDRGLLGRPMLTTWCTQPRSLFRLGKVFP